MLIEDRKGRKAGGITINIYEQYSRPIHSKTLTVHGYDVDEIYAKIKFFLTALENSKNRNVTILVEGLDGRQD